MTTPRTVKVYINNRDERVTFNNASFTIHPDGSVTITIDGEDRAYFPPHRYHHIVTE